MERNIETTYFGMGKGRNKPVLKRTFGSNPNEIVPNISRNMLANRYGAVVAEAHYIDTGELIAVATYFIGSVFNVKLAKDLSRPICLTNIPEEK